MNDDDRPESSDVSQGRERRRLLALLGIGGAAALAGPLIAPQTAHAGHDSSNTFHLGEQNVAPESAETGLSGARSFPLLNVRNTRTTATNVDSPAIRAETQVPHGAAISAFGQEWGVVGHGDGAGLQGFSFSGTGSGVAGHSDGNGAGVSGVTDTGVGVAGGSSGTGTGVRGMSPAGGVGVEGQTQTGIGVLGTTASGTAGRFEGSEGTALDVLGRAQFSTAGSGVVPGGSDEVFVPNADVTADSHISVTLTSDPGHRALAWVERADGSGFTVRLSQRAPGPEAGGPGSKPATHFTYLIVEPNPPE